MMRFLLRFCLLLCLVVGCTDGDKAKYQELAGTNRRLTSENQGMEKEIARIRARLERERAALAQDKETLDSLRREARRNGVPKVFTKYKAWNVVLIGFVSVWLVLTLVYYSILFYCLKVRARKRRGGR